MSGVEANELLWTGTEVLDAADSVSVRRLAGVEETLRRDRPLGGGAEDEFLDLLTELRARHPAAFSKVWRDPRAYFWALAAHDLTSEVTGTGAASASTMAYCSAIHLGLPHDALRSHLQRFKAFALGVALRAGDDWRFTTPFSPRLPLGIPGTSSAVDGPAGTAIAGVVEGRLDAPELEMCATPVARHSGFELPLDVHALDLPGWEKSETVRRAGPEFQARHVELVEQALAAIERYAPEIFVQFPQVMRAGALKPLEWGSFDDFSNPELPGSFILSVVHHPLELADHLIHEFQHNRLSLVEETGELFTTDPAVEGYYSPWRAKPRGLYGIFHGVYVFLALCRYWQRVYDDVDLGEIDRAYALDRVLRYPQQLVLAVGMLRQQAQLTPLGAALLAQLEYDHEVVRLELTARSDLPADAPAYGVQEDGSCVPECSQIDGRELTVGESICEHVERHDVAGHCIGLLDEV